jgi:hypothetical protein
LIDALAFLSIDAIIANLDLNTCSRLVSRIIRIHHPALKCLLKEDERSITTLDLQRKFRGYFQWDFALQNKLLPLLPASNDIISIGNVFLPTINTTTSGNFKVLNLIKLENNYQ